jgi:WD40 repeat protein
MAIYDVAASETPPRWVAFERPLYYEDLFFSEDGDYLLMEFNADTVAVLHYPDGEIVDDVPDVNWLRTSGLYESWGSLTWDSPDGQRQFKSYATHDEDFYDFEFSNREVYDLATGELLYELPDETIQVEYSDRHEPEGCDLSSFSMCGNVYSPSASHPYRMAFSASGESLAVLYRPPNLWNSSEFSTLRVYDARDGELLTLVGDLDKPVETFAYSPDGNTLLVGFMDGTVQLWDVAANRETFNTHHFNGYIIDLEYSYDGRYLIIQRPGIIEVRVTRSGALQSRFTANAFALSPVENELALGQSDGTLRVLDLEDGSTRFSIQAHKSVIFALAYSPDGKRLTSSGQDCDVRNWDALSGEFLHFFEENSTDAYGEVFTESRIFIHYLQYIPGTNQLLGYGSWSRAVSWNANSGATQYMIEPEPLEYYQGMVTLNPHFPEFMGVDLENQRFYIDNAGYDMASGEMIGPYQPPREVPDGCAINGPHSLEGDLLFTKGLENLGGQICVLDAEDMHLIRTIDVIPAAALDITGVEWLYMSPAGDQLIVNIYGDMIYVYQVVP